MSLLVTLQADFVATLAVKLKKLLVADFLQYRRHFVVHFSLTQLLSLMKLKLKTELE